MTAESVAGDWRGRIRQAERAARDLVCAPRSPVQQGHPEGVEFSWLRFGRSTYEVIVYERETKQEYRSKGSSARMVIQLPPGDYIWRVRIVGRPETITERKRFRVAANGDVESLKLALPADSVRYRLYRTLSRPIGAGKQQVRRVLLKPAKGSLRSVRVVEIAVFSWHAWKRCRNQGKGTVWVAHDLYALPVTFLLAKVSRGQLVYDAVEMSLGRHRRTSPGWLSRKIILGTERLCRRATCVLSGCPYLSQDLMSRHPHLQPVLFLNGQEVREEARSDYLRIATGQPPDVKIVLYIGYIAPVRGLEEMITAANEVSDGVHFVAMGPGAPAYSDSLRELATELGAARRVTILGPVPQEQVVRVASAADIGISPVSRDFGNGRFVLNNKVFQYIAAGLPVLASDVEGVGGFVLSEQIGDVFDERDPSSIATCVNRLVEDPARLADIRARVPLVAAKYSWDAQRKILLHAFTRLGPGSNDRDRVSKRRAALRVMASGPPHERA
jgi:glycosyltransferase involved in cell wall biosynthesis